MLAPDLVQPSSVPSAVVISPAVSSVTSPDTSPGRRSGQPPRLAAGVRAGGGRGHQVPAVVAVVRPPGRGGVAGAGLRGGGDLLEGHRPGCPVWRQRSEVDSGHWRRGRIAGPGGGGAANEDEAGRRDGEQPDNGRDGDTTHRRSLILGGRLRLACSPAGMRGSQRGSMGRHLAQCRDNNTRIRHGTQAPPWYRNRRYHRLWLTKWA